MPEKPSDKTFKEIVELVQNHENLKPSAIVQRFKFNTRFRKTGESIASYMAESRNISEHCDFQNTLEEILRDRLVCGINDEQIQRRLLAESTLDFKKAMKIATSVETAIKNAKDLTNQTARGNDSLNRVGDEAQRGQQGTQTADCGRCVGRHNPQQCKFKDAECFVCHKKGRIARKCRKRQKGDGQSKRKEQTPNSGKPRNYLNREGEVEEEQVNSYTLYNLGEQKAEPYVVEVLLNQKSVKMEVDTGAAMTVIGEDTFKALKKKHPQLKLNETKVRLHTYTREQVKVTGQVKMTVKYEEQEAVLPVLVIQGKSPNLIGRNRLQEIKLNWRNIFQLKKAYTNTHRVEELQWVDKKSAPPHYNTVVVHKRQKVPKQF